MQYLLLSLTVFLYTAGTLAGEFCATIRYDNPGVGSSVYENITDDPVEFMLRLRINKEKEIARFRGEICEKEYGSAGQNMVEECKQSYGYIRPIKALPEDASRSDLAASSGVVGGLEFYLDEKVDFQTEMARAMCAAKPDQAARSQCVKCYLAPFLPFCRSRPASLSATDGVQNEELQDVELAHRIRLPLGQDTGRVETRVVLRGTETTKTELIAGSLTLVKCPKPSSEERKTEQQMTKEINRITRP